MNLNINPNFNQTQSKNGVHKNNSKQNIAFGERYCQLVPKILGTAKSSKTGEIARTNAADFFLVQFANILKKRPKFELIDRLQTIGIKLKAIEAKDVIAISDTRNDNMHKLYFLTNEDAANIKNLSVNLKQIIDVPIEKVIKPENILKPDANKDKVLNFLQNKVFANIGKNVVAKAEKKFLPDLAQLNNLKNSNNILDNFYFGPIAKSNGRLKQIEGQKYPLGDNEGVFHSIKDSNVGYFTDYKDAKKIIGVIIPTEEGNVIRFMRKNGEIVDAVNNIDGPYRQVTIKDGIPKQLYEYVDGKGTYSDL